MVAFCIHNRVLMASIAKGNRTQQGIRKYNKNMCTQVIYDLLKSYMTLAIHEGERN